MPISPRTLALALTMLLVSSICRAGAVSPHETPGVRFDAIIELNARLCRTHVVLFARYWVSARSYRMAVVWAEPHGGSLNFPIYAPTLSMASGPNAFVISHQFQHLYDAVFPKPLERRGPFKHQFNSYSLADTRFAEQEALAFRVYAEDLKGLAKDDGEREQVLEIAGEARNARSQRGLTRLKARTSRGRLDEVQLFDPNGRLLKTVDYAYAGNKDGRSRLIQERASLPEELITVGFNGPGPTITIAGEKRQYGQLETARHEGGRRCVVDYEVHKVGSRDLSLPVHVGVHSGDQRTLLRCVRLYNFVAWGRTPDQIEDDVHRYGGFDVNDVRCRDMLLKYWMKNPQDIAPADTNVLGALRTRFAGGPVVGASVGQQLKHVNTLLQLGWLLGDPNELERSLKDYLALLAANHLNRMVLFGGQNVVETTVRWGQRGTGDRLLRLWLDSGVSHNDVTSVLEFGTASLVKGHFWTLAELMNRILENPGLSMSQRFVTQATCCLALARIRATKERRDTDGTDLATAQKRWMMAHCSDEALGERIQRVIEEAHRSYALLDKPAREEQILKHQLDAIRRGSFQSENAEEEPKEPEHADKSQQHGP